MPDITLSHLTRTYGSLVAVNDISAVFAEGTVTCLLGPSGCGKTTLMRMIAGLETPTRGSVAFGSKDVTRLPPRRRDVAMVFQYPVMYRTCSVRENVALPLQNDRTLSQAERLRRVAEVLEVLHLTDQADSMIDELDLGTRQKVAVGRAIARRCDVILFDEPTTNVEVHSKLALIRAFKEFRTRLRQTIIYVTHDQTEAMTLADQIALMESGRISQCAAPRVLYEQPESRFGGWFLGNPGMNFLAPRGQHDGGLGFDVFARPLTRPAGRLDGVEAGIRPEHVKVFLQPEPGALPARVLRRSITIAGQYLLSLAIGESRIFAKVGAEEGPGFGADVFVRCPLDYVVLFRDGQRLPEPARFA
jgi:ABC-type sugar transport system ATPase subunit